MCGRYHLTTNPWDELDALVGVEGRDAPARFEPRYNIAPSEPPLPASSKRAAPRRITRVPILRRRLAGRDEQGDGDERSGGAEGDPGSERDAGGDDGRARAAGADVPTEANDALWPLVPPWAKGEVTRYSTANARAEGLSESRTFARPWRRGQRCLIPASGFYEWQDAGERTKRPWTIEPLNDALFTFGGLWEISFAPDETPVLSCTIITVAANELMREIHNAGKNRHRMPLIVAPEDRAAWLDGDGGTAESLVAAYPADEMDARPITTAVNNPSFDDPKVLDAPE